jgi:hypothetical protein
MQSQMTLPSYYFSSTIFYVGRRDSCERRLQVRGEFVHELEGFHVVATLDRRHRSLDADRQIFGHEARLDGVDANLLQGLRESLQLGVVVEGGAVQQTASPCEDRSDGVGGGFLALLVLTVVTSDGSMGSFSFDSLAVGANQHGGHQTETSEALGDSVRLNISVVVLAGPDISAL